MPEVPDLTTDLQPTAQQDAPVVIDKRPQTVAVDTNQLDTTPQVVAGRVRVSDDISAQAEEQGYEPDIQPKAAAPAISVSTGVADSLGGELTSTVLPDTTAGQVQGLRNEGRDAEADEIVQKAAAAQTAFADVTAPLSVKTEVRANELIDQGLVPDPGEAQPAPTSAPDITKAPESSGAVPLEPQPDAPVLAQPNPDPGAFTPVEQTDPTAPGNPDHPL